MNIKIVQRKDRIYADGRCPLFFRFTQKRQCKYISTGIALTQEFWNDAEQRITASCPDSESLNWQLKEKLAEYQKQIDEYFQQQIDYLKNIGKVGSAVKYTSCKHLLEQCGLGRKRFEQIDLQYLQDFEAFLIRKGNTSNSIATKFSVLRAVYNKAVRHKVFAEAENPFKQYNVGRFWKPTRKRAITKEDVQRIQSLKLPASTEVYSTAFARDIFLFSYCVAGINFKDIATLRYGDIQNGRIYYQRHKTGKELLNSPILPQTREIMERYSKPDASSDDYIFPILDRHIHRSEQQICNRVHKVIGHVNANLKRIAEMAGLKVNLTTYVARHTFATVLKRSGVNIAIISESLGHSDLETTQIYLDSFENSQIDEAMKNLL